MRYLIAVITFLSFAASPAWSLPLVNPDFSAGLSGWTSSGDVSESGGVAVLTDSLGDALLYQQSDLNPSAIPFVFSFDFSRDISDSSSQFTFPDGFFVSLVFTNTPNLDLFSPGPGDVFELVLGAYSLSEFFAPGATLGASSLGGGWEHFSFTFNDPGFSYVLPVFALIGSNGIAGDSVVLLDNVSIAAVPEPGSLLLLGSGLLLAARRRRKSA